jgi:hypothetical protein
MLTAAHCSKVYSIVRAEYIDMSMREGRGGESVPWSSSIRGDDEAGVRGNRAPVELTPPTFCSFPRARDSIPDDDQWWQPARASKIIPPLPAKWQLNSQR